MVSEGGVSTYHSGGGVNDLHLLEDGGSVVRDKHFALGSLDLTAKATSVELTWKREI